MEPKDQLCHHPTPSTKENEAGTVNQMANRPRPARLGTTAEARAGAAASEELMPAILPHLDFLFAEHPLLPDEDPVQYDALLRSIVQQVKPIDVIEAIWVKDIVDLIWEAKRIRRWRSQIFVQAQLKAVEDLILPSLKNEDPMGMNRFGGPAPDALAAGWVIASEIEKERVDTMLESRGLKASDVTAHAFLMSLTEIESIDRLVSMADQRRDTLLREIERKRASFDQRARAAATDIIDADDANIP
ncbi:hypothetical protein MKK67_25720 [Methylobacterium sp. J-072]|uniref:hypothetical protein n=1 Tax=Methylobacterium sp. J-072 TaxID=2836651 RepID=UPI001FB9B096|nr:hypothetical protein [Methylobacterium sp. J-072]MCJ2095871.1 hypothetical protein [Methylobacterium sp. J-072]